jgi:hypothetical protein
MQLMRYQVRCAVRSVTLKMEESYGTFVRFLGSWICGGRRVDGESSATICPRHPRQPVRPSACFQRREWLASFSVTGWTLSPGPVWVPNFVVGIGRFDGKGNFAQVDYGADDLRTMGATSFRGGETGSYTVNPDCTGSQEIKLNVSGVPAGTSHGVIENMFVISGGGRSIRGVVAEFTPPGGTQPVSVQTRVDFWKVGSEQDN